MKTFSLLTLVAPISAREWAALSRDRGETREVTPLTYTNTCGYTSSAATNRERENVPCQR